MERLMPMLHSLDDLLTNTQQAIGLKERERKVIDLLCSNIHNVKGQVSKVLERVIRSCV